MKTTLHMFLVLACLTGSMAAAEQPGGRRLLAEWERTGPMVMVWPEHVRGGRPFVPLYTELIQALPPDVEPALVSPRPPDRAHLQEIGRPVRYLPVSTVNEMALLDWSGWPVMQPNGLLVAGTFDYPPRHITGRDRSRAEQDARTARELASLLYGRDDLWPITTMGTHWVHNGNGIALVSNRLIAENEGYSLSAITALFESRGGIEKCVFIPVPPGEDGGRIDGLVRFFTPDTLLVATPPKDAETAHAFSRELASMLTDHVGDLITIVPIMVSATDWSAPWGNDLHFIRAGSHIILPEYGSSEPTPLRHWLTRQHPEFRVLSFPFPEEDRRRLQPKALNRLMIRY